MVVWLALAALVVGIVVGLAVAIYRGFCLWRLMKRTSGAFTAELDRISRVTAEIDGQLQRADASMGRLSDAHERLLQSRSRLDVQLAAVREARAQVARTLWFVPGLG
jgi:hypothetical protein